MSFKEILSSFENKSLKILELKKENEFFDYEYKKSDIEANALVVIGPNGCGKSLIGKIVEGKSRNLNLPVRSVAMRNRTSSEFGRALIFGDESVQSTGLTSVKVCNLAMKSATAEKESIIIFDEPDLGLSEGFSKGLGLELGKFANSHPCVGVVLISHNRFLVTSFLSGYAKNPHTLAFKPYPCNLDEWAQSEDPLTDFSKLLELASMSSRLESEIESFLKKK